MNALIKKLAGECMIDASEADIEKFAKLIVEECVHIARAADNDNEIYAWWAIEQRFLAE